MTHPTQPGPVPAPDRTAHTNIEKGRLCSFVTVPAGEVRILQLTDVQIIDSSQMRRPDRLCEFERRKWEPERIWDNALSYIEEAVANARPHLIVLTGDNVYGEFDDSGRQLRAFAQYIDSFGIPWAPVFGNHDNESEIGPERQCDILEAQPHCLFTRGDATGYGNYTVTLLQSPAIGIDPVPGTDRTTETSQASENAPADFDPVPLRTLLMLDTHGCLTHPGIRDDQVELCRRAEREIVGKCGKLPPLFAFYHIPSTEFLLAAHNAGYQDSEDYFARYELGVTLPASNGDFGKRDDPQGRVGATEAFMEYFTAAGGDGIFVGHYHKNCTSIFSGGIRYTFGLKTGVYDYHNDDMLGSTLITLGGSGADKAGQFTVRHLYTRLRDNFHLTT